MIIYNSNSGYDCQVTTWPSKYKSKRISCVWSNVLYKQTKCTERRENCSFAKVCIGVSTKRCKLKFISCVVTSTL